MEANRDDAVRCLKIADKHLSQQNIAEAKRFVEKARKLYPAVDISKYQALFGGQSNKKQSRSASRERTPGPNMADQGAQRRTTTTTSPNRNKTAAGNTFNKSQLDPIRKVLNCKDYYQILGLSKEATTEEIKKAYKLLALKFHPDKNQAPGATEAFKKIGKANDVLSDPAKRKRYDTFGNEEEAVQGTTRNRRSGGGPDVFYQYETHQGYDADIFNMFFNGGFPFAQFNHGTQQRRQHAPRQGHESGDRENNYFVYLQLLPLLVLFGLSFFSSMMVRDPYFQMQRSNKYPIERFTSSFRVPYFVKQTFAHDYDGSLGQLERQVEEEYANNLRFRCFREKDHKESLMYRARFYHDEEGYQKAVKTPLPSCDKLQQIFNGG